jgi:hypothetical protein
MSTADVSELLSLYDDASLDGLDEVRHQVEDALSDLGKMPANEANAQRVAACFAAMLLLDPDGLVLAAGEHQPWVREPVVKHFGKLRSLFPKSAPAFNRIRLGQAVERSNFAQDTEAIRELAGTKEGRACLASVVESAWQEFRQRLEQPEASGLLWALVRLQVLSQVPRQEVRQVLGQLRDGEWDIPADEKKLFKRALKMLD